MAPLAELRVGAVVVDAAHLTMGDALLRTVVVALRSLGYLKTTALTIATEIGLGSGINEVHAIDIQEIIVEAYGQRIGNSHEDAIALRLHVVLLTANIHNDLLGLRSLDAEVSTVTASAGTTIFLIATGRFLGRLGSKPR